MQKKKKQKPPIPRPNPRPTLSQENAAKESLISQMFQTEVNKARQKNLYKHPKTGVTVGRITNQYPKGKGI